MGTSYFYEGSVDITPPLSYAEIQKATQIALDTLPKGTWNAKRATSETVFVGYLPLKLDLSVFDRETDEGILKVTQASALVPSFTSDGTDPTPMKDLLEAFIKGLPGHNWSGAVYSIDEYRNRAYKVEVTTGKDTSTVKFVSGTAFVRWEDGSAPDKVQDITG